MAASSVTVKKVLFMHGLESGPNGRKVRHLKTLYDVRCVDMNVSLFSIWKPNSILRCFLLQPTLWAVLASSGAVTYLLFQTYHDCSPLLQWGLAGFAWLAASIVVWRVLIGNALQNAATGCMNIQRNEINSFKPDIVIASSWGGGIALLCAHFRVWTGPMLLLAPSYSKFLRFSAFKSKFQTMDVFLKPISNGIVIVHGLQDDVVLPVDSEVLCRKLPHAALHLVRDGHRLDSLDKMNVAQLVQDAVMLHGASEVAL
jgi:hypothetical protein